MKSSHWARGARSVLCAVALAGAVTTLPVAAHAQMFGNPQGYMPIKATMAGKTVTLTGHDLTIEQVMDVARRGAKVEYSAAAKQNMEDNYGLLLEAPLEGVSVYWFTRAAGGGRETRVFEGDPLRADNKAMLEKKMLDAFRRGADAADDPRSSTRPWSAPSWSCAPTPWRGTPRAPASTSR